jgi:hypothetical protein
VSIRSGARLPTEVGSGAITCSEALDLLGGLWSTMCPMAPDSTSLRGGLWVAMSLVVPCGPRASIMKKSLAILPMQQGSPDPNAWAHISKVSDARAIKGLQDVWADIAVHASKTCKQAATVWLQCSVSPVDHSPSTATVQGDPTT